MSDHTPPEWMLQLGRNNATVYAFLNVGLRDGFSQQLFEEMAKHFAAENDRLVAYASGLLQNHPGPLIALGD